jgi:hypothetical protein
MNATFTHSGCEVRIQNNKLRITNADGEWLSMTFDTIGTDEDVERFAKERAEFFAMGDRRSK